MDAEVADLRNATEYSSFVLEVDISGVVQYVSSMWTTVIGWPGERLVGRRMADVVAGSPGHRSVFDKAIARMREIDSSVSIRFAVRSRDDTPPLKRGLAVGPAPKCQRPTHPTKVSRSPVQRPAGKVREESRSSSLHRTRPAVSSPLSNLPSRAVTPPRTVTPPPQLVWLEAQGILIQEDPEHPYALWVVSPYVPKAPLDIHLPPRLVEAIGVGAQILAQYLEKLATAVSAGSTILPEVKTEVCRICDCSVQTWWFERHSELCALEHRAEAHIVTAHDRLLEIRQQLASISSPSPEIEQEIRECDAALDIDLPDTPGTGTDEASDSTDEEKKVNEPEALGSIVLSSTAVEKAIVAKQQAVQRMRAYLGYEEKLWAEIEAQVHQVIEDVKNRGWSALECECLTDYERGNFGELCDHYVVRPQAQAASPIDSPVMSPRLSPHLSPQVSLRSVSYHNHTLSVSSDDERKQTKPSLSIKDYELLCLIAKGGYGAVYLSRKRSTKSLYAIKVMNKKEMLERHRVDQIKQERQVLMSTTESPYVAKLYATFQTPNNLYLVLEYLPGGDFASLLRSLVCLPENWARRCVAEAAVALDSIHKMGITHGDIKPGNMLIDATGHLRLSDFGLSRRRVFALDASIPTHIHGTPDYTAPEVIEGKEPSTAIDWWSLGCVLFELVYGYPPFNDETPSRIFENILSHRITWPNLDPSMDISPEARECILGFLKPDPTERLGAGGLITIKQDPFFNGIHWECLFEEKATFIPPSATPNTTDVLEQHGAELLAADFEENDLQFCSSQPVFSLNNDFGNSQDNFAKSQNLPLTSEPIDSPNAQSGEYTQNIKDKGGASSVHSAPVSGSAGTGSRPSSRLCADEFGLFSFKNVPYFERANNEVISKLRSDRRTTASSPALSPQSPAMFNVAWTEHSLLNSPKLGSASPLAPGSPSTSSAYSSDYEDPRTAALQRVQQRRLESRRSFSQSHGKHVFYTLDVLVCHSQPVWRYTIAKMLSELHCRAVMVDTGDEAIRRALGPVQFDAILLESSLGTQIQAAHVLHLIRQTPNVNSRTPILLMTRVVAEAGSGFTGAIETPITSERLVAALRKACMWKPKDKLKED